MTAYPTVSISEGKRFLQHRRADAQVGLDALVTSSVGTGQLFDTGNYSRLVEKLDSKRSALEGSHELKKTLHETFEAQVAVEVLTALREHPAYVLADGGFWRYLSLGPFWDLSMWRARRQIEQHAKKVQEFAERPADSELSDPGALSLDQVFACVSGLPVECLPWRLLLRAQIAHVAHGDTDDYSLTDVLGVDLWWSHIFRVQIGRSRPTAQEMLREVKEKNPVTNVTRDWAKRITQLRATVLFEALSDDEIRRHVDSEFRAAETAIRSTE